MKIMSFDHTIFIYYKFIATCIMLFNTYLSDQKNIQKLKGFQKGEDWRKLYSVQ